MRSIDTDVLLEKMKKREWMFGRESDPICLIEDAQTINSWYDVKDKLPVIGDLVIVSICDTLGDTSYNYTSAGWYSGYDGKWVVDNEFNNYVYAWMPFPEPSKEEK